MIAPIKPEVVVKRRASRPDSRLTREMELKGYWLSSKIAKKIGVHKATVYRWIRDGLVNSLDFNGAYYVEWNSVVEHLGQLAKILGISKIRVKGKASDSL